MELSEKQEAKIARYLRDVAVHMDFALPAAAREAGLERIEAAIRRAITGAGNGAAPPDAEVDRVLARMGTPESQAELLRPREAADAASPARKPETDRVWLGVCSRNARRIGVDIWVLRLAAVVFGCITGPLAVIAYLAGYAERYWNAGPEEPRIDWMPLVGRVFVTILIVVLLDWGVAYAVEFIHYVIEDVVHRDVPALGQWGWLDRRAGAYYSYAMLAAVPLAFLSGLPLAGGWDYSLKRLSQAVLAVYATMLSFGLASMLVGIILHFVEEFGGMVPEEIVNLVPWN